MPEVEPESNLSRLIPGPLVLTTGFTDEQVGMVYFLLELSVYSRMHYVSEYYVVF